MMRSTIPVIVFVALVGPALGQNRTPPVVDLRALQAPASMSSEPVERAEDLRDDVDDRHHRGVAVPSR